MFAVFARRAGGVVISRVQSCLSRGEVTPRFRKCYHHVGRAVDEVTVPSAEQPCRTKSKRETVRTRLCDSRADGKTGPGRNTGQEKSWRLALWARQREREASVLALFMRGCEAACLPWTGWQERSGMELKSLVPPATTATRQLGTIILSGRPRKRRKPPAPVGSAAGGAACRGNATGCDSSGVGTRKWTQFI